MKQLRAIDSDETKGTETISNKEISLKSWCKPAKQVTKLFIYVPYSLEDGINGTRQGDVNDVESNMIIHIKR